MLVSRRQRVLFVNSLLPRSVWLLLFLGMEGGALKKQTPDPRVPGAAAFAIHLGLGGSLILSGGGFGRNSEAGTPTTLGLLPVLAWGGWAGRIGSSFCAGVGFLALAGPVSA